MADRGDRGQAAVEFCLVLPIILAMSMALVTVGIAIRNELAVELAAREGARAAVVAADPATAATVAATRSVTLPVEVTTDAGETTVTVTVVYADPFDIAVIGRFIGPVTHRAKVTMAVEPPTP